MAQKVSHLSKKHVIEIFSYFEIEPSRLFMHMTSRETCLIRSLFGPSHHTPVRRLITNARKACRNKSKLKVFDFETFKIRMEMSAP